MNTFGKQIFIIVFLVVALLLAFKLQSFVKNNKPEPDPVIIDQEEIVACTMDAMICPDGSYVGRSGPKCEFVCPAGTSTPFFDRFIMHLGEKYMTGGKTLEVIKVLEDSRCPSDVQCIQAGRVVLVLSVDGISANLEIGKSVDFGDVSVILDDVMPYPISTHKITDTEYMFHFSIKSK